MIHIYDLNQFSFFSKYLNYLSEFYDDKCVDIFINVIEENNLSGDPKRVREIVAENKHLIENPNVEYSYGENRGGDIGTLVLLSQRVSELNRKRAEENEGKNTYRYCLIAHSKSNAQWRKDLCSAIFNVDFEGLTRKGDMGIMSARKWIQTFDPIRNYGNGERFRYHIMNLASLLGIENPYEKPWDFIGGTMFVADIRVIEYLANHNSTAIYGSLNKINTVDVNWVRIVKEELRKDTRGCGNDLEYRLKYQKPLLPDYMVEHAMERVVGLICRHLNLKVYPT